MRWTCWAAAQSTRAEALCSAARIESGGGRKIEWSFVKLGPIALLHNFSVGLLHVLQPLGVWGVGALAFIDSALVPIPMSMDGVVLLYVAKERHLFLLYCLVAAAASAIGSLVPFFIGRGGGELFLLKRINRERYERMLAKFERQEFLAIMIPAMCPPPFPLKLFEFAAGVFEMRAGTFLLAIFCGKMTQFVVASLLYLWFGPKLFHSIRGFFHAHFNIAMGLISGALFVIVLYIVRKVFDAKRGEQLPSED
jgi:membrane protein YqaA with SNARE-associated domain